MLLWKITIRCFLYAFPLFKVLRYSSEVKRRVQQDLDDANLLSVSPSYSPHCQQIAEQDKTTCTTTTGICGMRVSGLGLDGGSSSGYGSSGKAERDHPSTPRPVNRDVPSVNVLVEERIFWIIKIESRLPESDKLF